MGIVVVIILSVAVFGLMYAMKKGKENKAIEDGDMVKRDNSFFKQKHIFKTHIRSIDEIYKALNSDTFARDNMEYSLTSGQCITFEKYILGQGMTSALKTVGETDGMYIYSYSVERFTTREGMEAGYIDANIALTAVEKAIYSLDDAAQVERTNGSYKTKWL